jgi:hypothetical protein
MRKVLIIIFLLASAREAQAATTYYAQSAAGLANGADCADALALPSSLAVSAGNVYIYCGTGTYAAGTSGAVTLTGGGSSGNPAIFRFAHGAIMQAPYWGQNGAIRVAANYITVDGSPTGTHCGRINGAVVACDGTIQATASGANLTYHTSATFGGKGVWINANSIGDTVQDVNIQNLFVPGLSGNPNNETTQGFSGNSMCVYADFTPQHLTVQYNTCTNAHSMVRWGYEGTSGNTNLIQHNEFSGTGEGIWIGAGSSGATIDGGGTISGIIDNDFSNLDFDTVAFTTANSSCAAGANHQEFIHLYTQQTGSQIGTAAAPFQIADNIFHGRTGCSYTAESYIECDSNAQCGAPNHLFVDFFNNTVVSEDPNSTLANNNGGNGMAECEGSTCRIWNNTYYASVGNGSSSNFAQHCEAGSVVTFQNNILDGMNQGLVQGGCGTVTANTNLGFGLAVACGAPCSQTGNPLLNTGSVPPYQLTSTSSAAYQHGLNLFGTITAMNSDALGVLRPSSGSWDMGAFEFVPSGPSPAVTFNPASGIGLGNVIVNNPVMVVQHISNTGAATLSITSMTVGGTNPAMFTRYTTCGATLAVSQGCEIAVKFIPTSAGAKSATVSIVDNAPGSPHVFNVTGTGVTGTLPTLDQYGGTVASPCVNTTGRFHVEQVGLQWTYCTPLGNQFYLLGVYLVANGGNAGYLSKITAKYGSSTAWAVPTLQRIQSWGFNSPYYKSGTNVQPFATDPSYPLDANSLHSLPIKMPVIFQLAPGLYGMRNAVFNATTQFPTGQMLPIGQSIKNMAAGWSPIYTGFVPPTGEADYFDPNLVTFSNNFLASQTVSQHTSPYSDYILGYAYDDGDQVFGLGAGPDFPTTPIGHNNPNLGWLAATMAPTQTVSNLYPAVYTSTTVNTKAAWTAYLQGKYSTIAALNTAWGSSYTTFGSSGSQIVGEAVGTGNGSTTTFTHTLAHLAPSPFSVQIFVNGVVFGGDLGKGTTGNMYGVTAAVTPVVTMSGTITYSTGALSVTFVSPPSSGASITVSYIQNGWRNGTGLLDEDGRVSHQAWLSNDPFLLAGANANTVTDLNNFLNQLASHYLGIGKTAITAAFPGYLFLGPDTLGSWQCPPFRQVLQALPGVVDIYVGPMVANNQPNYQAKLDFIFTWAGNIPQQNSAYLHANPDSPFAANPVLGDYASQFVRGQAYANLLVGTLNSAYTSNGVNPFIAVNSFDYIDIPSEQTNWGLVTLLDNAYDGKEDVTGTVTCSAPLGAYTCGGESSTYGNYIGCVQQANLFGTICSGVPAPAISIFAEKR